MKKIVPVGVLLIFLVGCRQEEAPPLSQSERKEVSQRYADTVRVLTPVVDSLCTLNHDKLVKQLSDSIYADRLSDIDRQRKRFKQ